MQHYQQVGLESAVADASPHELIRLLMQGALDYITKAKGALQRGDIATKAQMVVYAVRIINGLSADLDIERGGEIASNLESLYDYMSRRLIEANVKNDPGLLDEVASLLREIKVGWDGIAPHKTA